MSLPLWQVDAFSDGPFTGNPAAVCVLHEYPEASWMQSVAAEMNLSETSFVVPSEGIGNFQLRWFTPGTEVDLCGHATLAAVHVLYESGRVPSESAIHFQTRSGELVCQRDAARIVLDFPQTAVTSDVPEPLAEQTLQALGCATGNVLQTKFDLVVVLDDAQSVRELRPHFQQVAKIETRGVAVTAPSDCAEYDFISRFFAPSCGINEDPVTGSAHCGLAPFWSQSLQTTRLVGYQASPRGGFVHCEVGEHRVKLSGQALTILEGHLLATPIA
ncbi:MAG: PhzF family phenazine biosynthesis protein [Planctomycetota bacterium]